MCFTFVPTGKNALTEEKVKQFYAQEAMKKAMRKFFKPVAVQRKLDTAVNLFTAPPAQLEHLFVFDCPRFSGGVLLGKVTDVTKFDYVDRFYGFRRTDNAKRRRPTRTPRPWMNLF